MAVDKDGKAYVWGSNINNKLGISDVQTAYPIQIEKVQDLQGNEIPLKKIEIVDTYKDHSCIADEDGSVYTVGLNTKGELGTKDKTSRDIFTKIDKIEITSIPEEISVPVTEKQEIIIEICNSFNLKTDIANSQKPQVISENSKEALLEKIEGIDNSKVTNIKKAMPNYKITGEKIGRTYLKAEHQEGYNKNIWVNIVADKTAVAPAKVVNGNGFTVALRSNGTIWSFGILNNQNAPEQIQMAEEIIDISCRNKPCATAWKIWKSICIRRKHIWRTWNRKCTKL